MKKLFNKLFDKVFLRYVLVGGINTLFGTSVMFICYNVFGLSYWPSTAANYILGSILSYFLNSRFTFKEVPRSRGAVLRFALNIAVCYVIAYRIAQPLAHYVLSGAAEKVRDNCAMLVGMGLYVGLNYLGQRFFAFRNTDNENT